MSVGRRLLWSLITLIACTGLLGGAALVGLVGLSRHFNAAQEQYEQLRVLYEIGHRAASVRLLLNSETPDQSLIHQHLLIASQEAQKLLRGNDSMAHSTRGEDAGLAIRESLLQFNRLANDTTASSRLSADMNRALNQIASFASAMEGQIIANRTHATEDFQRVLVAMAVLFAATIIVAAAVGMKQYRSVMTPLHTLDRAITDLGDVRFGRCIPERGDREFRRLVRHFNRTSSALADLYSSMRQQVEIKSRQLMRSEQLASVGCLAAGLAHEINNPLAIIAGYAEKSLKRLRSPSKASLPGEFSGNVERALETICDEAFRCRDITRDLLLLAQPIDGDAKNVPLLPVVERAIALVRALPLARDREVVLQTDNASPDLVCHGHPSQLLQVFINLLTNALEACPPQQGRVAVSIERQAASVIVAIADNGCGMNQETLARAFDPFFTDKPRRGIVGCGLGLSISHAIVERHGGWLYAQSDGPNCGSRFSVELAAVSTSAADAICLAGAQ